mmetsp:Transcript_18082/g.42449  ORF Transcript_18082/g.42449 Transcript_18082/m.42449 type:complete len:304 (+) Transcript_18082:349-1260(+)
MLQRPSPAVTARPSWGQDFLRGQEQDGSGNDHQREGLQAPLLELGPDGRVLPVLLREVREHLVAVLQSAGALRGPARQELLAVPAGVLQALQAVEDLDHRQPGRPDPLLHGVHELLGRGAEGGHVLEGAVGLAQHRRQLAEHDPPDRGGQALGLQVQDEAEVGQGRDELVVQRVAAAQVPEAEQGLEAVQQAALPAEDVVGEDMGGGVQVAVQHEGLHELARLLQGVLLQKLEAVGVVVHLLRLSPRRRSSLRGLVGPSLLRLSLLLELELLLLRGAHVSLLAIAVLGTRRRRLSAKLPIIEL